MPEPIVLVLAASARWLAQAGREAGYAVWAIDQFADADTRALCQRQAKVEDFGLTRVRPILAAWLDGGRRAAGLYGGGLECYPETLDYLSNRLDLWGNGAAVFRAALDKKRLFRLFSECGLAVPEVSFQPPGEPGPWLFKPQASQGGAGIRLGAPGEAVETSGYWQRFCPGQAGSVLFAADGRSAKLLAGHRQYPMALGDQPFLFAGLDNLCPLDAERRCDLTRSLSALVRALNLTGLNTLDLIVQDQQLLALEINARLSACLQLYPGWLALHRRALAGFLPETDFWRQPPSGFRIVYAREAMVIPANWHWPTFCHDCPPPGSRVDKNQPLCTIMAKAATPAELNDQLEQAIFFLNMQLTGIFHGVSTKSESSGATLGATVTRQCPTISPQRYYRNEWRDRY